MNHKGFTLLELLIVIAVIGILAAIAIPSYQISVRKSHRTDAKAALSALQIEMEKFRGSCVWYPGNVGNADVCGASSGASSIDFSGTSYDGYYTISVTAATANSYTLRAAANGDQADDSNCDPMTITVTTSNPKGVKAPADCW